ncbi:potassium channel family protein [Streptomyces aidingensis]|uniref:Trk system potassium uptake protein TrkA n=1 Tax=Streptomyces aidingensis TaxID=910347 RepID=A0A1I1IGZ3_9ACTN|nr:TrkA family potassium uptake protein [Streptomyces aidingensis]SFC35536.1 trk system potassium uptake protein TrkA [Streptomyces aidingensis]
MHIVIMGCGRVGAALAQTLEKRGHSIAVIDQEPTAFRRLGSRFGGRRVTGVGFDRDTLEEAGIAEAGAFAAVSSGDNSNIIAARTAREVYGVRNVAARIYDPRRAEVYERLGIPTVATVRWTADQMLRRLLPAGAEPLWRDPTGAVQLSEVHVASSWTGHRVSRLQERTGVRVAFLTRMGEALLPTSATVLQEGDLVHVIMRTDQVGEVEAACMLGPDEEMRG